MRNHALDGSQGLSLYFYAEQSIAVDLNSALEHLGGILGKTFVDDLLDQIFNDFCIGK